MRRKHVFRKNSTVFDAAEGFESTRNLSDGQTPGKSKGGNCSHEDEVRFAVCHHVSFLYFSMAVVSTNQPEL